MLNGGFLTVEEVANMFRMSKRRVQEYVRAGELPAAKPFGRVLIYKSAIAQRLGCKVEEL
jgi:excisionase family DNA binding protein